MLIRGARQIGKTTAVRIFAEQSGLELIELNMEKAWSFTSLVASNNPRKLIEAIEFELNRDISPDNSLLFFDEIQAVPQLLGLLRYFYEEIPELAVIATGSLLEFTLAQPDFSLPVGRIELYYMGPFSFEEFISVLDHKRALEFLNKYSLDEAVPDVVHEQLNKLVRLYTIIGGMPEAIAAYRESGSLRDVERIKSSIIETFILDFNKYKGKTDTVLLRKVFESLPAQLGKKVIYSHIIPNVRANEVSSAIEQLSLAKVLTLVFHSSANGIPLAAEKNERYYKPLHLDIGLCLTQLGLNPVETENAEDLNFVNRGTLAEQFIGQQLYHQFPSYREPELFYWTRESRGASAEVDYLITDGHGGIIPIEVKSGRTGSLRSLQTITKEKGLSLAIRFNSDKPSVFNENRITPKGDVKYRLLSLPHYLVQQVDRLLQ
nr:AAA family ATPase [Spirochaeta isovalerica]